MTDRLSGDEIAGIVGMFGALTPDELHEAYTEVVYKARGEQPPEDQIDEAVDAALEAFQLVKTDTGEGTVYIAGPTAFPEIPEFADDLPVMLDVEERKVDRSNAAEEIVETLAAERANEMTDEREVFIEQVSYDIEAWADIDANELRDGKT